MAAAGFAGGVGAADGFGSPSGTDDAGDLVSSDILVEAQTSGAACVRKNVNFYQLEDTVSTPVDPSAIASRMSR